MCQIREQQMQGVFVPGVSCREGTYEPSVHPDWANQGNVISATFRGTVMPDAVDAKGNGRNGHITVLIRPLGGQCPNRAACMGEHLWPGNEDNWPPLEAHYQMTATRQ